MRNVAVRFFALFFGFFSLYALTAQRGLGWGDSGEFQYWVLHLSDGLCGASFSNSHPLYVLFARVVASSPFQVTLVSAFLGALAVAGLYLCARRVWVAALFGLAHGVWWLSTVAEVQTMSLAFTAFETWMFLEWWRTRRTGWLVAAFALNGMHMEVHNFALLSLPVYAMAMAVRRVGWRWWIVSCAVWMVGACYFLYSIVTRSLADVLVGHYGAQVVGVLPSDWRIAAFNMTLAALSLWVPICLMRRTKRHHDWPIVALLFINAVFWVRYFVPDQFTFVLPTAFFAFHAVAEADVKRGSIMVLAAAEVLLPVAVYFILANLPVHELKNRHPERDEAQYFALPWKHNENSADRYAARLGSRWTGYPNTENDTKPDEHGKEE